MTVKDKTKSVKKSKISDKIDQKKKKATKEAADEEKARKAENTYHQEERKRLNSVMVKELNLLKKERKSIKVKKISDPFRHNISRNLGAYSIYTVSVGTEDVAMVGVVSGTVEFGPTDDYKDYRWTCRYAIKDLRYKGRYGGDESWRTVGGFFCDDEDALEDLFDRLSDILIKELG